MWAFLRAFIDEERAWRAEQDRGAEPSESLPPAYYGRREPDQ